MKPSTKAQLATVLVLLLAAASCRRGDDSAGNPPPPAAGQDTKWVDAGSDAPAEEPAAPASEPAPERESPRPVKPPPAERPREAINRLEKPDPARAEPPPAPEAPPAPQPVTVSSPAGSAVSATLDAAVSSDGATVGQAVAVTLAHDVADSSGRVVLPAGTRLTGRVAEAVSAKRVKKKSVLALHFDTASLPDGTTTPVSTGLRIEGEGYKGKDAAIIGGAAAGGALLGQVLGGDTGSTAAGAVIGGAIGTGVALGKKGEDITLPAGTTLELTFDTDVVVTRLM